MLSYNIGLACGSLVGGADDKAGSQQLLAPRKSFPEEAREPIVTKFPMWPGVYSGFSVGLCF